MPLAVFCWVIWLLYALVAAGGRFWPDRVPPFVAWVLEVLLFGLILYALFGGPIR